MQVCVDGYAILTYITDYFSKGDIGLTKEMKKAINDTKGMNKRDRLNYVKKVFFTHRQVCVAEATYKLIPALKLKNSNVVSKFLQTGFPENRTFLAQKLKDNDDNEQELNDEDLDHPHLDKEVFTIEGKEGFYTKPTSLHDKYSMRPDIIEKICLGQFVISYEVDKNIKDEVFEEHDFHSDAKGDLKCYNTDDFLPKYILLEDNTKMRLRTSEMILRLFSHKNESAHEQYYALLLVYHHWRDESELHADDYEKCREVFLENENEINENRRRIFPFSKSIQVLKEMIEKAEGIERPAHILDGIDVAGQEDNLECEDLMPPLDTTELPEEGEAQRDLQNQGNQPERFVMKPIVVDNEETMKTNARNLSFEQKVVFNEAIHYLKCLVIALLGNGPFPEPPNMIVTGK